MMCDVAKLSCSSSFLSNNPLVTSLILQPCDGCCKYINLLLLHYFDHHTRLFIEHFPSLTHIVFLASYLHYKIGVRLCQGKVRETRYEANDETDTLEVTSDMILEGEFGEGRLAIMSSLSTNTYVHKLSNMSLSHSSTFLPLHLYISTPIFIIHKQYIIR